MQRIFQILILPLLLLGGAMLAACGGRTPVATNAPTMQVVPPPTAATSAAPAASPFATLEQGVTPEGYRTLGAATAPVELVMYSDFL